MTETIDVYADVHGTFGAPPGALSSRPRSLIAYALDAGIRDQPRRAVMERWIEISGRQSGGHEVAPSIAVARPDGSGVWVEPTAEGHRVLICHPAGWSVTSSDELIAVSGAESSMAPARRRISLVETPAGRPATDHHGGLVLTAIAALAVGVAARALSAATVHATSREQFGKPIGTFQAVSHRLARSFRDLVVAQELLTHAEEAAAGEGEMSALLFSLARQNALRAATAAANAAVQTCGASGFRLESTVGEAFRQIQEDRMAARVLDYERSALRRPLVDAISSVRARGDQK